MRTQLEAAPMQQVGISALNSVSGWCIYKLELLGRICFTYLSLTQRTEMFPIDQNQVISFKITLIQYINVESEMGTLYFKIGPRGYPAFPGHEVLRQHAF